MSKFSFNLNSPATNTTANTGGLFGSTTPATTTTGPQQTTLGLFGFGTKTTTQAATQPQSGGLGTSTGFGTGFGTKQTTLGFGLTATVNTTQPFGAAANTTAANTSFSFGQTTPATTQPAASTGFGGFGGFGSPAQTQPQQQQASFGGFGQTTAQPAQTSSIFSLNQTQQQPQQSIFSLNQPQQQQQQQNQSLLNTTQQQTQQQAPTALQEIDHLMNALVNAQVFNDERDLILAKWNQLQAFYGTGKIFYQNMSIDVTKDNRLTRFKTIGYSCKPLYKNEDGLVCLVLNKKESDVKTNQKQLTDALFKIFNSDQALTIRVDSIKPVNEDKTEFTFYVEQRLSPVNEALKSRVASMQVFQHLNKQEGPAASTGGFMSVNTLSTKQTIKQQLEQLGVATFYPLVGLTDEQIKSYLDKPPAGFDHNLWDQGKKKNPNPKKLLPVQIVGFQEINKRFKLQDQENHAQKISINIINDKIEALNGRNNIIRSKIEQFKSRNEDLEQRILKVLISYELRRKSGIPIQENEKYLANVLESYEIELNSPINKEIREQKLKQFNEVISSMESASLNELSKRQTTTLASATNSQFGDIGNLSDVQKSLREQHLAFKSLIEIINQDLKDLNTVKRGLLNEK